MLHCNIVPRNRGYKRRARWRAAHTLIRGIDPTSGILPGRGASPKPVISEKHDGIGWRRLRELDAYDVSCFPMGNTKHTC